MTATETSETADAPSSDTRRPFPVGPFLVLLVVALLVVAAIAEVVLRIGALRETQAVEAACSTSSVDLGSQKGLFVLDPVAGYTMAPNVCVRLDTSEYDSVLVTNSRGEVGPEIPATKAPGEFRVVVLGDSYTAGGQVPYDQNFTALLEQRLHADGHPNVRVINAGVGGYTEYNELGTLQNNIAWMQPDLVVEEVTLTNDVGENVMATAGGYRVVPEHPKGVTWGTEAAKLLDQSGQWFPRNALTGGNVPPPWDPSTGLPQAVGNVDTSTALYPPPSSQPPPAFKTRVHNAITDVWNQARSRSLLLAALFGAPVDPSVSSAPGERPVTSVEEKLNLSSFEWTILQDPPHTYWLDVAWPLLGKYLGQIHDLAAQNGAPTLVVVVPDVHQFDDQRQQQDVQSYRFAPQDVDWTKPDQQVEAQASADGVPVLDLLPVFQARSDKDNLYLHIDEHFSALGHQVVADSLASYVEASGWLR